MRLCGISSRFRLLSPGAGQVAHALLTRPPLSHAAFHPGGLPSPCFVRLACVRHAASVHPEPGSNSHNKFFPASSFLPLNPWLPMPSALKGFFWLTVFRLHSCLNALVLEFCPPLFPRRKLFESFKVIPLFSYQGPAVCFPRQLIHITTIFCSRQQLF